jgi:uncharacterized protein (TIGR00661 family)
MNNGIKRCLVCPLGWGLGHASRLIPVIDRIQKSGVEVIVAGDEMQIQYLANYFPSVKTICFLSFKVTLTKRTSQLIPLIGIAFRLPYHIIKEHLALGRIVQDNNIDLIISDNRYGLWHRGIKSILITHQLRVLFPKPFRFLEPIGEVFVRFISKKFTQCWIPDFSGDENLAGMLSHPAKIPSKARYIGSLSRFDIISSIIEEIQKWDLVGMASGPSPQREIFIELIAGLAKRNALKTLIIKGIPTEGTKIIENDGIFYAGHLSDIDFEKAVKSTKYLITRAGYSTIMDLMSIGISGLIVPTPGQTEQEYLAEYLSGKGLFRTCKQNELVKINISFAKVVQTSHNFPNLLIDDAIQGVIVYPTIP